MVPGWVFMVPWEKIEEKNQKNERNGKKIGEKLKKIGGKVEIIRRNWGKNWMMTKHDKQTNKQTLHQHDI